MTKTFRHISSIGNSLFLVVSAFVAVTEHIILRLQLAGYDLSTLKTLFLTTDSNQVRVGLRFLLISNILFTSLNVCHYFAVQHENLFYYKVFNVLCLVGIALSWILGIIKKWMFYLHYPINILCLITLTIYLGYKIVEVSYILIYYRPRRGGDLRE